MILNHSSGGFHDADPSCHLAHRHLLRDRLASRHLRAAGDEGITAFQYVYATGSGFWFSALAAIGAAIGSVVLVIAVLGFAKNPALRLIALAIFAIPAVIAGFALVHGVTKHMIDSAIAINILGGIGGLVIGIAAVLNLNAVGTAALSR